ncbi:SRPBCC family protein [Plantactinospora sp. B5E13]|uniref:SRPBCC family protein n=1 Tax=unclassified Plantactinospora TaxID=2631981 RepID=UPI00325DF2F4
MDSHDGDGRPRHLVSRALGVLSLGLGVAGIGAAGRAGRLIGVDDSTTARTTVLPGVGARELLCAAGLLAGRRPTGWLWARVAGDAMDLAALAMARQRSGGERRQRIDVTLAVVAGVTALDLTAAVRTTRVAGARRRALRASATVTINRPVDEVYRFWRDFENLPRFMYHLESVRADGDGRSHWTVRAPGGRRVEWDAEIVEDRLSELISWRSVKGARVPNTGRVRFIRAAGGRGTEVRVDLAYAPPGGAVGRAIATLFGEEPRQQIRDDLRRFKQVIETGEVVRSDGSPDGLATPQQVRQQPARPAADQLSG